MLADVGLPLNRFHFALKDDIDRFRLLSVSLNDDILAEVSLHFGKLVHVKAYLTVKEGEEVAILRQDTVYLLYLRILELFDVVNVIF